MKTQSYILPFVLLGSGLLTACGETAVDPTQSNLSLDMAIPDSLTGGKSALVAKQTLSDIPLAAKTASRGTSVPCAYLGVEDDDDIFRNGYETTRFMVSAVATWSCIADLLIDISAAVPHNGVIFETENDNNSPDYESDEPTHYSVSDESVTQTTVRLYYNYSRSAPPISGEDSQFYISWNESDNGDIEGRMIIDGSQVNPDDRDPEDPVNMRMDFLFTETAETADMFLRFDSNNPWADGFRIQVAKDLTANPLQKVFDARGMINMKAQFLPISGITEVPEVQLQAVADSFGNGASIAEFRDLSLPLPLNIISGNDLGDYLFTKTDIYFFEDDMDWDYINKTVTASEFRGGRTTPATGGTWIPFDPSLDVIVSGLALDPGYFTGSQCAVYGDDCNDLFNTINNFVDGFAGMEQNQGTDPMDWRSAALAVPNYLDSVYPNGIDWTDAFELSFTPSAP
jgi:hypothetical protein